MVLTKNNQTKNTFTNQAKLLFLKQTRRGNLRIKQKHLYKQNLFNASKSYLKQYNTLRW